MGRKGREGAEGGREFGRKTLYTTVGNELTSQMAERLCGRNAYA